MTQDAVPQHIKDAVLLDDAYSRISELERGRDALQAEIDLLRAPVSPSNLRDLGEFLANLLDEDRWPAAERWLNAALSERASLIAERDAAIRRAEALREAVDALLEVAEQSVDTRQCSLGILRAMNQARAAIDADRAEGER